MTYIKITVLCSLAMSLFCLNGAATAKAKERSTRNAISSSNDNRAVMFKKDSGFQGPELVQYSSSDFIKPIPWPDRTSANNSISGVHVYPGWEVVIFQKKNYGGKYKVLRENSSSDKYYELSDLEMTNNENWADKISSVEIRKATSIPKFKYKKENPSKSGMGSKFNVNELQGIANDGKHWYISNMSRIYKCKKNDMSKIVKTIRFKDLPAPISKKNHSGDMDFYGGFLYVPAYVKAVSQKKPILVRMDKNFENVTYAHFPTDKQRDVAWVAINPNNGLIYSAKDFRTLNVYDRQFKNGETLKFKYSVKMNMGKFGRSDGPWWNEVMKQGGEFGADGLFYYVLDHKTDEKSDFTGIYAFKINGRNGYAKRFTKIRYNPDAWVPIKGKIRITELEGITFWDLGNHSKYPGQLHLIKLHLEGGEDKASIKHYQLKY